MTRMHSVAVFAVVLLGSLLAASQAAAVPVQLPFNKFGKLENRGGRCQATAAMNSFTFLETMYPKQYKNSKLTKGSGVDKDGDGDVDTADARDELAVRMACGASEQSIWEGKLSWFDEFAPRTTIFHGMVDEDPATWVGGANITRGKPNFGFLLTQLLNGEDIEMGFRLAGGGAHVVTLTSADLTSMKIDFIDPNNPNGTDPTTPKPIEAVVELKADGFLHFEYWDNGDDARITFVFAESPLPLPGTLTLTLLAGGALLLVRLRRRSPA